MRYFTALAAAFLAATALATPIEMKKRDMVYEHKIFTKFEYATVTGAPVIKTVRKGRKSTCDDAVQPTYVPAPKPTTVAKPSTVAPKPTTVAPKPTTAEPVYSPPAEDESTEDEPEVQEPYYPTAEPTTATSTTAAPSAEPSSGGGSEPNYPADGDDLASECTKSHNVLRWVHGAEALQWDDALAKQAETLSASCNWGHDDSGPQNLAAGYNNATAAIIGWYSEVDQYTFGTGFSHEAGHLTQMLWKEATKFGCANVYCETMTGTSVTGYYLTCNYDKGNVVNDGADSALYFRENVTPALPEREDAVEEMYLLGGGKKSAQ